MNTIEFSSAATVHKGNVRKNNEDNLYLNGVYLSADNRENNDTYTTRDDSELLMYAVFDGMGGEASGEEASFIAADTFYECNRKNVIKEFYNHEAALNMIIQLANENICRKIIETGVGRMGTTMALLFIRDDTARIYNIGDSRVYLLRDNRLTQITIDDTTGQRLIDLGVIKKEELKKYRDRHRLTQHLGVLRDEMEIEPHISEKIQVKKGDKFLLCSDGLTEMVSDERITEIIKKDKNEIELTKELVNEALLNGGIDNVTAMVVSAGGTEGNSNNRLKSVKKADRDRKRNRNSSNRRRNRSINRDRARKGKRLIAFVIAVILLISCVGLALGIGKYNKNVKRAGQEENSNDGINGDVKVHLSTLVQIRQVPCIHFL